MHRKGDRLKAKARKNSSSLAGSSTGCFKSPVVFSFRSLDSSQHLKETFECWEKEKLLVKLLNKIRAVSQKTMSEAMIDRIIKIYDSFPPKDKTAYSVPNYLSEELQWASMHLQGKAVIAGHVVENIFYIVFLDREHKFWKSKKKNT
ncbi:hypothetical protein PN36_35005 [Candidatus Thiomargarita nelsonii]|uniref:Uncharacterized protein n=1 Tax=Candidatus Thiomargarita nelsonii TaxID=1003181 RepID=A0A4E0QWG8_9GAMM|nr:hypothetical protein PN36_35005 [Candidatus Thiomargarita nelsonii]